MWLVIYLTPFCIASLIASTIMQVPPHPFKTLYFVSSEGTLHGLLAEG